MNRFWAKSANLIGSWNFNQLEITFNQPLDITLNTDFSGYNDRNKKCSYCTKTDINTNPN